MGPICTGVHPPEGAWKIVKRERNWKNLCRPNPHFSFQRPQSYFHCLLLKLSLLFAFQNFWKLFLKNPRTASHCFYLLLSILRNHIWILNFSDDSFSIVSFVAGPPPPPHLCHPLLLACHHPHRFGQDGDISTVSMMHELSLCLFLFEGEH